MAIRTRLKPEKKHRKRRSLNGAYADDNVVPLGKEILAELEAADKEKEKFCIVCKREIGGRKVYLGNHIFRCYDCYPGSVEWMKSEIGLNSKYRSFFERGNHRKSNYISTRKRIGVVIDEVRAKGEVKERRRRRPTLEEEPKKRVRPKLEYDNTSGSGKAGKAEHRKRPRLRLY